MSPSVLLITQSVRHPRVFSFRHTNSPALPLGGNCQAAHKACAGKPVEALGMQESDKPRIPDVSAWAGVFPTRLLFSTVARQQRVEQHGSNDDCCLAHAWVTPEDPAAALEADAGLHPAQWEQQLNGRLMHAG